MRAMATDFPKKGDDLKISLRNSEYPQFDRGFAENIKEFNPEVWGAGGNIRGNDAFTLWGRARDGSETEGVLDWIKEREAWAARHFGDGEQFAGGDLEPNLSNVGGVIAQIKWGVIGNLGEQVMKDVILELVKKLEGKKDRAIEDLSDTARKTLENKIEEHNADHGDDPTTRATLGMLSECYFRGIGAYKTNPGSVRPGVASPEQWAIARVNSLLFCLRNGRFQGGKHDTDLLPEGHPESTKGQDEERKMDEQRHIKNVTETDDSYIVEFGKSEEMPEVEAEVDVEIEAENGGHVEEERKAPAEMETRKLAMRMDAEMDSEDDRRMSISISSEAPVDRSFGIEILDHNDRSIDLSFLNSGNAPLLLDHDPERQIGVIESVNLDSSARRLRATVRFSKGQLGSEVYDDVRDGIRKNVSIGYQIGRMERDERAEGGNTYRVRSWKPFEASIVSIPADDSVGTNRNAEIEQTVNPIPAKAERKETKMSDQDIQAVEANVRAEYAKTVTDILELGAAKNKRDLADQAIKNGLSVEQFRGMLAVATADQPLTTADEIGMEAKEVRRFSLINAIRAMANPTDINAQRAAQFEFEASAEAQRKLGRETRGLMIPGDVLRQWSQRDINTTDDAALIAEDLRTGDFIDVLRNASSVMAAGARMLSGLQGDVVIPKKTAASTANWIASEGTAATESEPTLGSVTMSMKTVGATTDVTRNMMHQSSMDIETLIRDDLTQSIASAIDLGALAGSGSSGQPTGIKNTSGINAPTAFAAANPTFAEVVAMETAVAEDNALGGSLAYILPAGMYGALKTTAVDSGSGRFVADGGLMNGYNAIVSNQATAGDLYFGDFSQLLVGMYGGLELIVDPYSSSKSGGVSITALQSCDVAVRHAVAFAFNNDGA
jgi:HK97 family phage major capsid protein/HK97 family phage prohead protease